MGKGSYTLIFGYHAERRLNRLLVSAAGGRLRCRRRNNRRLLLLGLLLLRLMLDLRRLLILLLRLLLLRRKSTTHPMLRRGSGVPLSYGWTTRHRSGWCEWGHRLRWRLMLLRWSVVESRRWMVEAHGWSEWLIRWWNGVGDRLDSLNGAKQSGRVKKGRACADGEAYG